MTRVEKQQSRIDFIKKEFKANHSVMDGVHILKFNVDREGKVSFALILMIGTSSKSVTHCRYPDEETREKEVTRVVCMNRKMIADKEKKLREKKDFLPSSKVGDIFVCSWGYEQTQVDFYKLLSLNSKTGTLVKIGSETVLGSEGFDYCNVVPLPDIEIGDSFKKRIMPAHESEYFRFDSVRYCRKWQGKPMYHSWGY